MPYITSTINHDGKIIIIQIGNNKALYEYQQTDTGWTAPLQLSLRKVIDVALTKNQDGRLALLYIGDDNKIFYRNQQSLGGAWGDESSIFHKKFSS